MSRSKEQPQRAKSFADFFASHASSGKAREKLQTNTQIEYLHIKGFEVTKREVQVPYTKSVEKNVRQLRERGEIPVLADENISIDTLHYLRSYGIGAIHVSHTHLTGKSDERIYSQASELRVPIVTHDNDFLNHKRFDPNISPGIFIIPADIDRKSSPLRCQKLALILDHIIKTIQNNPNTEEAFFRKYDLNGQVTIYSKPFRPDKANCPFSIPTSIQSFDFTV